MSLNSSAAKCLFLLLVFSLIAAPSPGLSMDDPLFTISRMVLAEQVSAREPVHVADTFPAGTEEVFCFLEAKNIEADTEVSFIWSHEGRETVRIVLPLQKGPRWRTFSSKKIRNQKGGWTVELLEESGIVLNTVSFQVQ